MGRELTRGWVEEHAKGGAGLLDMSWYAGFGCLVLVVEAKSRELAGSKSSARLSDPAKCWPA